jgi:hypothetical protein
MTTAPSSLFRLDSGSSSDGRCAHWVVLALLGAVRAWWGYKARRGEQDLQRPADSHGWRYRVDDIAIGRSRITATHPHTSSALRCVHGMFDAVSRARSSA